MTPVLAYVLQAGVILALVILIAKVKIMSDTVSTLDTSIATLVADNVALKAAVDAAPAAIATLVAAGIASAASQGATTAQLQGLADLHTALMGDTTELQAALAGTPPVVPTPVVAPTPDPTPTPSS
jgi:hypothetical protein